MKLFNFVVLELLVLLVHSQKALDTLTTESTLFMLSDSRHCLSICLLMELHFWNGSFRRSVHEIMHFCCLVAAAFLALFFQNLS